MNFQVGFLARNLVAVIFFSTDFFLPRPKDLEIARGQNLFSDAPFFSLNVFERQWASVLLFGTVLVQLVGFKLFHMNELFLLKCHCMMANRILSEN